MQSLRKKRMEQEIKIAAKLYECRDTAKRFFKSEFQERIRFYKRVIEAEQMKSGTEILQAVTSLCEMKGVKDDGMAIMMFMAAAVELMEPSS